MRIVLSVLVLAALGAVAWSSFTVELGGKTLVEHTRAIAATKEAKALGAGVKEEAGHVAEATKEGAAKAAEVTKEGATKVAETVAGGVKHALGKDKEHLAPRDKTEPAIKVVERPEGAPPPPPDEKLDAADRRGLDKLVKRASR